MSLRIFHICKWVGLIVTMKLIVSLLVYYNVNVSQKEEQVTSWHRAYLHAKLNLDTRREPSEAMVKRLIQRDLPSLPLEQLVGNEDKNFGLNETCARYPQFSDIKFSNDYWQVLQDGDETYYIFGAYFDNRSTVVNTPVVRLLVMMKKPKEANYPAMHCQLWFRNQLQPLIVPVAEYNLAWAWDLGQSNHVLPTLISCQIPVDSSFKNKTPLTVSLVAHECDRATNNLVVYNEVPPPEAKEGLEIHLKPTAKKREGKKKKHFAVCVKALDFPYIDFSVRIIEWLEMVRLLGADRVIIYVAQMHPNTTRTLRYYAQRTDFVEIRGFAMARGEPHMSQHFHHWAMDKDTLNRLYHEVAVYNDCFYRYLGRYDYFGLFDTDELLMPLGNITDWTQLVETLDKMPDDSCTQWASYCFRNVYFPRYSEKPPLYQNVPEYFYMLQHVQRVAHHLDWNLATKCLHSSQYVIALHNHFPLSYVPEVCAPRIVPTDLGQLQHYREPDIKETLNNSIKDDNIWRFHEPLINRTMSVLKVLGFLN